MKTQKGYTEVGLMVALLLATLGAGISLLSSQQELRLNRNIILRQVNKCENVGQVDNSRTLLWKCPTLDKVYTTAQLNLDENGFIIVEQLK